jgi:hypothetical protein
LQAGELFGADWRETRVLQRGAGGTAHDNASEWLIGFDYADAATEAAVHMQSNEGAAALSENSVRGNLLRE